MKTIRRATLLLALFALVLLAGCGNKGALVHPDNSEPAPAQG